MPTTAEQNLWLNAARRPIEFPGDTRKDAERQKFTLLNMKRRWLRSGDPFANNCDFVEIVIRAKPNGTWACIMQPKGHRLHDMLARAGLNPDGTFPDDDSPASPNQLSYNDLPQPEPEDEALTAQQLLQADFGSYLLEKYGSAMSQEANREREAWLAYGQCPIEDWKQIAGNQKRTIVIGEDGLPESGVGEAYFRKIRNGRL